MAARRRAAFRYCWGRLTRTISGDMLRLVEAYCRKRTGTDWVSPSVVEAFLIDQVLGAPITRIVQQDCVTGDDGATLLYDGRLAERVSRCNQPAQLGFEVCRWLQSQGHAMKPSAIIFCAILASATIGCARSGAPDSSAQSQPPSAAVNQVNCADFQQNPDSSWSPLRQVIISNRGATVTLGQGASVGAGDDIAGLNLAEILNQKCRGR